MSLHVFRRSHSAVFHSFPCPSQELQHFKWLLRFITSFSFAIILTISAPSHFSLLSPSNSRRSRIYFDALLIFIKCTIFAQAERVRVQITVDICGTANWPPLFRGPQIIITSKRSSELMMAARQRQSLILDVNSELPISILIYNDSLYMHIFIRIKSDWVLPKISSSRSIHSPSARFLFRHLSCAGYYYRSKIIHFTRIARLVQRETIDCKRQQRNGERRAAEHPTNSYAFFISFWGKHLFNSQYAPPGAVNNKLTANEEKMNAKMHHHIINHDVFNLSSNSANIARANNERSRFLAKESAESEGEEKHARRKMIERGKRLKALQLMSQYSSFG